jgi:hypothetical protein
MMMVTLCGCGRAPSKSGLITSFGDYPSPDKQHTLQVEERSVSLVFGSLVDTNRTTVFTEAIGSDAMRWCFHWSADGSLWAYSSDTGYFKQITPKPGGAPDVREVSKGEKVPKAVFDFLPSSLRSSYIK